MNAVKLASRPPGTVDLRYDFHDDLVFARPRWTLETPADVMRWYELHARYFGARFSRPKDLITIDEAFEVSPGMVPLWERYSTRLHESVVRFSALVSPKGRRQPPASGPRPHGRPIEAETVVEAVAAILARRTAAGELRTPSAMRTRAVVIGEPPVSGRGEPDK